MSGKQLLFIIVGAIIGWYAMEKLLFLSVIGMFEGGAAAKAQSNQIVKNTLTCFFLAGVLMNTVQTAGILDIWKHDISAGVLKGLGLGISGFYLITFREQLFMIGSIVVLYGAFLWIGYGVGHLSGSMLKKVLGNTESS